MSTRFLPRFARPRCLAAPLCFFLIWGIILGVPCLRLVLFTQASSDETLMFLAPYVLPLAKLFAPRETPQELAARFPADSRVQMWALEGTGLDATRKMEPLLRRFPREAWLHAAYLVQFASGLQSGRVERFYGNASLARAQVEKPPNLSRTALERAVTIAEEGARLEPDNGFFDTIRAFLLFALRRDDQALLALRNGGRKKHFDDHIADQAHFIIEAEELQGPQIFEQRLASWTGTMYPHLAKFRHLARLALWSALQREQKGDWQDALAVRAALMRIGARMRDSEGSLITPLVGVAFCHIAWQGKTTKPPAIRSNNFPQVTQFWSKHFAALCKAHGRSDLAAEALREAASNVRFDQQKNAALMASPFIPGIPDRIWVPLGITNWVGLTLLFQLAATLPAWLALSLILWLKQVPGEEKGLGAVFGVYAFMLLVGAGAFYGAARILDRPPGGWGSYFWGSAGSRGDLVDALRWTVSLAPLFGGALICALVTWWSHRKALREADLAAHRGFVRVPPLVRTGVTRLLFALLLLSVGLAIYAQSHGLAPPAKALPGFWPDPPGFFGALLLTPLFPVYMLAVFVAWWIFSSLWLLPASALPLAASGVKWLCHSLGATLLLSSALYLFLLPVALQARTQADSALDTLLRRGEMAAIRSFSQSSAGTQNSSNVG